MANEYPNLTGVQSELIEEQVRTESLPPSPNTILIFGTAEKGELLSPTRVTSANIESVFGKSINDPYRKYDLVKGFHEIVGSMPGTEVIAVRIGNAKKAKLDLYESQLTSGDYSPQSVETVSLTIEALTEGIEGNDILVTVYGNDTSAAPLPSRLVISLPNGVTKDFDLVSTYKTPSSIAVAINADTDLSAYVRATSNVLEESDVVTVLQLDGGLSGQIETTYDLSEKNIIDITSVYTNGSYEDAESIVAGRSSATLAKIPTKVSDENTPTVTAFWSKVVSEKIESSVGPGVTASSLILASAAETGKDPKWVYGDADSITDLVLTKVNSSGTSSVISAEDYTVNQNTGAITFDTELDAGDSVYAAYAYKTQFVEAKLRSQLQIGNPYSYFVTGSEIIFGAAQVRPLTATYLTNSQHTISSTDLVNGTITFALDGTEPAVGDSVTVNYVFEPELPSVTGKVANPENTRVQLGQLAGGSTGRKMTPPEYYAALEKGYLAADSVPCRIVIPQGVYVDDVMEGLDFETGLPATVNAGFHTQLSRFVQRHSQYVSECTGIISVRPMSSTNPSAPSLLEKEEWYKNLVTVSTTDGTVAANVASAINDYHLVVTVGDLILSHPSVAGGRLYVEGAHNIVGAMKLNHDNLSSIITRTLPSTLIRGMQYKIKSSDRINAINGMRYTLITEDSDTGALKIAAAPTMASATSQFRKQYNLDITIEAVNIVRRHVKRFIGQPNKQSTREAMKRLAEQKLQELSPDKLIAATVNIIADRNQAINGNLQIDLLLVTAVEIERINIRTRLELGF